MVALRVSDKIDTASVTRHHIGQNRRLEAFKEPLWWTR